MEANSTTSFRAPTPMPSRATTTTTMAGEGRCRSASSQPLIASHAAMPDAPKPTKWTTLSKWIHRVNRPL